MSDKLILVRGNTMLWLYSTPLLPSLLERRWTGPFSSDILFTPLNGGFNGKKQPTHVFENHAAACETAPPPALRQLSANMLRMVVLPCQSPASPREAPRLKAHVVCKSCVSRSELADRAICCRVESSMRRATGSVQRPCIAWVLPLKMDFTFSSCPSHPRTTPPLKKKRAPTK